MYVGPGNERAVASSRPIYGSLARHLGDSRSEAIGYYVLA